MRRGALVLLALAPATMLWGCRGAGDPAVAAHPIVSAPVGPLPGTEADPQPRINPFDGDKTAIAEGRRFFVWYNCAGCHGDHGGGGMGPSLRDEVWLYGNAPEQIANSITEGRAYGMPAWGRMLTPAQIWQITAYIKTLRTPHEAEPPL